MTNQLSLDEPQLMRELEAIARVEPIKQLLEVVCRVTRTGFACVARVTAERWIAGAVLDEIELGVAPGGEIQIDATLCDGVRRNNKLVVIDDVSQDTTFCDHPTLVQMGIQCYISVPIVLPDGTFFGTLCALDRAPNRLSSPEVLGMFTLFADLIAQHLDSHLQLERSQLALFSERETADLREEFIAVLGHDLRNPLAAIQMSAVELSEPEYGAEVNEIGGVIRECTERMNALIADVLDFARGRLGGGIGITAVEHEDLASSLMHVIDEIEIAHPDRDIRGDIRLDAPVRVDVARLSQLISNLAGNAITHGDPGGGVWTRVYTEEGQFVVEVANRGDPIPDEVAAQLFLPFRRNTLAEDQDGLGLGLYIASEIARGHGGTLELEQGGGEIRFVFRMPMDSADG